MVAHRPIGPSPRLVIRSREHERRAAQITLQVVGAVAPFSGAVGTGSSTKPDELSTAAAPRTAAAVDPPTATGADARDLLHDVHQITGAVALVATDRSGRRGAITMVEPAQLGMMQDRLHHRGRGTELVADVVSAPAVSSA